MTTDTTPQYLAIGSYSEGTLRPEDLIPEFLDALETVDPNRAAAIRVDKDNAPWFADGYDDGPDAAAYDPELPAQILDDLYESLDCHCPPYCYFGSTEGDGACIGVWVSMDSVESAVQDREVLKVPAGDAHPQDWQQSYEYILEVTDHGNCALVAHDGRRLWDIV